MESPIVGHNVEYDPDTPVNCHIPPYYLIAQYHFAEFVVSADSGETYHNTCIGIKSTRNLFNENLYFAHCI